MPLGMLYEREVVRGDYRRERQALWQRVMRTVENVERLVTERSPKLELAVDKACKCRDRSAHEYRGSTSKLPARNITAPRGDDNLDVASSGERSDELDHVASSSRRALGDRRDVDANAEWIPAHEPALSATSRQSSRWRDATARHVSELARAAPAERSSRRNASSVSTR